MLNDVHIDDVSGTVIESIDFKVEPRQPLVGSEGELVRMKCFWIELGSKVFVSCKGGEEEVNLAIQVWRINKRLGVAEFDVPLRLNKDERHTR